MSSVSPELTFLPIAHPHEITSRVAGERLVRKINRFLHRAGYISSVFYAKLDPHHGPQESGSPAQQRTTWLVEIVPMNRLIVSWFTEESQWRHLRKGLRAMFRGLRDQFDLVPTLITRGKQDGMTVDTHWPGGGCHLHYGADLFDYGVTWYGEMERFHRNLVVDYANKPWIRWLFSQWFADESNTVSVNLEQSTTRLAATDALGDIWRRSFYHRGIEPRFMRTNKGSHLTFEFRMFSMVANPRELRAAVRFLDAWVQSVKRVTRYGPPQAESPYALPTDSSLIIPLTLTRDTLLALNDIEKAEKIVVDSLTQLGLSWREYQPFFQRNYVNRVAHGQMV